MSIPDFSFSEEPVSSMVAAMYGWGAESCSAMDLYRFVFRLGKGFIQREWEPPGAHKANPLILGGNGGRMHRKILFDDTFEETLREFQEMDWAVVSGCTYWGRSNDAAHQSKLCAMIFDLDGQDGDTIDNFLSGAFASRAYPVPNFVVLSGNGVHLYYVFAEPVSLYPNVKVQMKGLKYALTDKMWNRYTSRDEHPQHQGINQGFRVVGGKTKPGAALTRAVAFRFNHPPYTPEELAGYVPGSFQLDMDALWPEASMSLDQASKKYPEWYDHVVVGGHQPGHWVVKRDLYDWWKRQIKNAVPGHRYFCLMALAVFGVKCGLDRAEVERDAMAFVPFLDGLDRQDPFTEKDAKSALECFDERYVRFPRDDIAKLTAIPMPANKRNGRKQALHLRLARANLEILNEDAGHALQGRPKGSGTKADAVRAYKEAHPDATQREIAAALGCSKTTVNKWLRDKG